MAKSNESVETITYSMFILRSYAETTYNSFVLYHLNKMESAMAKLEVELNTESHE